MQRFGLVVVLFPHHGSVLGFFYFLLSIMDAAFWISILFYSTIMDAAFWISFLFYSIMDAAAVWICLLLSFFWISDGVGIGVAREQQRRGLDWARYHGDDTDVLIGNNDERDMNICLCRSRCL